MGRIVVAPRRGPFLDRAIVPTMGLVPVHELIIESEHRSRLEDSGLDTLESCLEYGGGELVKAARPGRDVRRVELSGVTYYLKRALGRTWKELPHEAHVLVRLQSAGLPVPSPAAFGAVRGAGALITVGLPAKTTLENVLAAESPDSPRVMALLLEAGRLLGRLHGTGTNHRDYYSGHLLLDADDRMMLVDLGRAEVRSRVPNRRIVKDLAALVSSLPLRLLETGAPDRILDGYLGAKASDSARARLWAAVRRREERMRRHVRRAVARGVPNFHVHD